MVKLQRSEGPGGIGAIRRRWPSEYSGRCELGHTRRRWMARNLRGGLTGLPGDQDVGGLGAADIFVFEGFRFDRAAGCLFRTNGPDAAEPVALGSRALALLALLVERQGQLVTKDEIFAAVWPGTVVEEANLTVQISALRRILDRNRAQGSCIQTIPGRGYRFIPAVTRAEGVIAAPISGFRHHEHRAVRNQRTDHTAAAVADP